MPRTHIMLDLETLGVGVYPVVLSIGAVKFDPTDATPIEEPVLAPQMTDQSSPFFFTRVSPQSCVAAGAKIDDRVLDFWMTPELDAARPYALGASMCPAMPVGDALLTFTTWLLATEGAPDLRGTHLWSHGLTFDANILQHYHETLGVPWPVHFRNARDTRTIYDVCGLNAEGSESISFPPAPVKHHPVWDAWRQARAIQLCHSLLRGHLAARHSAIAGEREQCRLAAQFAASDQIKDWSDERLDAFATGRQAAVDAIAKRSR